LAPKKRAKTTAKKKHAIRVPPKKRAKTTAKKKHAIRVPKKRPSSSRTKKQLSIAERFAASAIVLDLALRAHWKSYLAEQKLIEVQRNLDEWLEREAIQTESFVKEVDNLDGILSPERHAGESDRDYAKRCIKIAKKNGLELDYHYTRIAQLSGLSNRQIYTLWVSPDALVA
jgi:hypothetical protein